MISPGSIFKCHNQFEEVQTLKVADPGKGNVDECR